MIRYVFSYDPAPNAKGDVTEFMDNRGYPFWLSQPGVRGIEVFTRLGSSPMVETHVLIDGFAEFGSVSSTPRYHELQAEVARLVAMPEHHFLLPRADYHPDTP